MLSAIVSDPTALPLWVAFLFAVAMYPLGLLLPGCPCCSSGCTQCGILPTGYAIGQDQNGRMCCTGSLASSVTLRVTSVGPVTTTAVRTTPAFGTAYFKWTFTFPCTVKNGDYVLSSSRLVAGSSVICSWKLGTPGDGSNTWIALYPKLAGDFPAWKLQLAMPADVNVGLRQQRCDTVDGIEACNIGTTSTQTDSASIADQLADDVMNYDFGWGVNSPFYSTQKCNPSGNVLSSVAKLIVTTTNGSGVSWNIDSGCILKVEVV